MRHEGKLYRPPSEADALIVQATIGARGTTAPIATCIGTRRSACAISPSSGGGGAAPLGGSFNGVGGGGGGAIHLVALRSIVIHGAGGINAGGCGGKRGGNGDGGVGGAGGSGGAILIETPTFDLRDTAVLAVNGGAAASNTQDGENGELNANPPDAPAASFAACGKAGNGGAGATRAGANGTAATAGSSCGGGAGGGSVGRIRINNGTGQLGVPGGATISPTLGAPGSTSTVGTLDVR